MNHRNELFQKDSQEVFSKYIEGYQEQCLKEHTTIYISLYFVAAIFLISLISSLEHFRTLTVFATVVVSAVTVI